MKSGGDGTRKRVLADEERASVENAFSSSSFSTSPPPRFSPIAIDDDDEVHRPPPPLSVSPLPSTRESSSASSASTTGVSPRLVDALAAAGATAGGTAATASLDEPFRSASESGAGATHAAVGVGVGVGGGGGGGGVEAVGNATTAPDGVGENRGRTGATTATFSSCDRREQEKHASEWWREALAPPSTQRPVTRRHSLVGGSFRSTACLSGREGGTCDSPSLFGTDRGLSRLTMAPMCGFSIESKQRRLEGCLKRRCGARLRVGRTLSTVRHASRYDHYYPGIYVRDRSFGARENLFRPS